jgi:hypothetical protein
VQDVRDETFWEHPDRRVGRSHRDDLNLRSASTSLDACGVVLQCFLPVLTLIACTGTVVSWALPERVFAAFDLEDHEPVPVQ